MRRLMRWVVALILCWLALWGLASFAAPKAVDAAVSYAIPIIGGAGIAVDSLDYGAIQVAPTLTRASSRGVSAAFDLSPSDDITLSSTIAAQAASVRLVNPLLVRGDLTLENFECSFHETDRPRRLVFDRLTNAHLRLGSLPLLSPRSAMREILDGLEELFLENAQVGDFEFRGDVVIRVEDQTFPAHLYTERLGDSFRLRFRETDIESVARGADLDLSPEQIEIVSLFPIRTPFLIRVTRQARDLSRRSFPSDVWLKDALRHISWSYLLTHEFGPEFATEVTDAQETGPGNTPDERAMDYHNNAVGRRFAADGIPLANLPQLVRSHPDVIRHPDEVASRAELLR